MIKVTNSNGLDVYLAATNIASVNQAGESSQWHGIRSNVHTFDKRIIECQQDVRHIANQLADFGGIDIVARHGGSVEIEAAIRAEPALPKPLY